jgi:hypothetical protein
MMERRLAMRSEVFGYTLADALAPDSLVSFS